MVWIVFFALVCAAAASGALFRPGAWYDGLRKPAWTPPKRAFPIVWTILYVLIAVAGALVWKAQGFGWAMALWTAQLALNALWSALFFGARRMDLAFWNIAALWLAILGFMVAAWPVSAPAALLFAPYLAWVSLAAALNRAVWRMNAAPRALP